MPYLLARCPMYGCNQKNLICSLQTGALPEFEARVYVLVRCAQCGQEFRELGSRLELSAEHPTPGKT